jgi:N-acetylglutamate synthase-like GNAT family acetyltransferase
MIYAIINDAAMAYKGVIPADRWKEPYMSREYLQHEIDAGVQFRGYEVDGKLAGVMGIQDVQDVTLIRHAYVLTSQRNRGIGAKLITHLMTRITRPALVGTWVVRFYERHGFRLVTHEEKERLLRKYWSIPERQTETSVVLADSTWWKSKRP